MNSSPLGSSTSPRESRSIHALLLGIVILPFFINLDEPPLWDGSEPFYAETAREMTESGNWMFLQYNYRPRWEKPPLPVWILAGSYRAFGVNEFAARFPGALAASGLLVMLYFFGGRLAGPRAGLLAAALTGTSLKFFGFSRQFFGDVLLALCFVAAFWLFQIWADSEGKRRWPLALAWFVLGNAVMVKGPLGLLPAFVGLAYLIARRRIRLITPGVVLEALAIVAIVGVPWYAVQVAHYGWEYLSFFLIKENLSRFAEYELIHRPFWYYVPALLGSMLPASMLLVFCVGDWVNRRHWRTWRESRALLPGLWLVLLFVFFSIPQGKRENYLMTIYPAVGLLLGMWLGDALERKRRGLLGLSAVWIAAYLAAVCVLGILLYQWLGTGWGLVLAAFAGAAVLVVAFLSLRGRWLAAGATAIAAQALLLVGTTLALTPLARYRPVPELSALINSQAEKGDPVVTYRADLPSFMFYAHRPVVVRAMPGELDATLGLYPQTFLVYSPAESPDPPFDTEKYSWRELGRLPYLQLTGRHLRKLRQGEIGEPLVLVRVAPKEAKPPEGKNLE